MAHPYYQQYPFAGYFAAPPAVPAYAGGVGGGPQGYSVPPGPGAIVVTQPLKARRTHFSPAQKAVLERDFGTNPYPSSRRRKELSAELGVSEMVVAWWFAHRRARDGRKPGVKRKQRGYNPPDASPPPPVLSADEDDATASDKPADPAEANGGSSTSSASGEEEEAPAVPDGTAEASNKKREAATTTTTATTPVDPAPRKPRVRQKQAPLSAEESERIAQLVESMFGSRRQAPPPPPPALPRSAAYAQGPMIPVAVPASAYPYGAPWLVPTHDLPYGRVMPGQSPLGAGASDRSAFRSPHPQQQLLPPSSYPQASPSSHALNAPVLSSSSSSSLVSRMSTPQAPEFLQPSSQQQQYQQQPQQYPGYEVYTAPAMYMYAPPPPLASYGGPPTGYPRTSQPPPPCLPPAYDRLQPVYPSSQPPQLPAMRPGYSQAAAPAASTASASSGSNNTTTTAASSADKGSLERDTSGPSPLAGKMIKPLAGREGEDTERLQLPPLSSLYNSSS